MRIADNGGHGTTRPMPPPMNRDRAKPPSARPPGVVRIIGGEWRGTRLPVADRNGLRPTADRVRETLFNWLQPMLPGARVLDLFAGTGALGLEAVSRGAAQAILVERDPAQAQCLREAVQRLHAEAQVRVVQDDALRWLAGQAPAGGGGCRIAFVDPPFAADLWAGTLQALPAHMAVDGWIDLESPVDQAPSPPSGWRLHRELRTAQARAALYRVAEAPAAAGDTPGAECADTLAAANPAP